jgi:hypothetical protein
MYIQYIQGLFQSRPRTGPAYNNLALTAHKTPFLICCAIVTFMVTATDALPHNARCFQSHYLVTAVASPIFPSLPSSGPACHLPASLWLFVSSGLQEYRHFVSEWRPWCLLSALPFAFLGPRGDYSTVTPSLRPCRFRCTTIIFAFFSLGLCFWHLIVRFGGGRSRHNVQSLLAAQ